MIDAVSAGIRLTSDNSYIIAINAILFKSVTLVFSYCPEAKRSNVDQ